MRWVLMPARVGPRVIAAAMFAAAAGASVATAVTFVTPVVRQDWIVTRFALTLAVVLAGGAIGWRLLMPRTAELKRQVTGSDIPALPLPVVTAVAGLGVFAAFQIPSVLGSAQ